MVPLLPALSSYGERLRNNKNYVKWDKYSLIFRDYELLNANAAFSRLVIARLFRLLRILIIRLFALDLFTEPL